MKYVLIYMVVSFSSMSFCSQKNEPESKPSFIKEFLLKDKIAKLEQANQQAEALLQATKESNELMRKQIEEIHRLIGNKSNSLSQTDEMVYQMVEKVLSDEK